MLTEPLEVGEADKELTEESSGPGVGMISFIGLILNVLVIISLCSRSIGVNRTAPYYAEFHSRYSTKHLSIPPMCNAEIKGMTTVSLPVKPSN